MVDISSQNNKINVTVSSSGNTANTNVTPDYARYYSEKSKEWAISNRIVDNIDYSSKYYANESKKQAVLATEQATIATNKTSEVVASGNTALSNIDTAKNNAITSITNQEMTSKNVLINEGATQIGLIQNEGATQVANVQSTGFYMRDDKLYYINSQGEETEFKLDDIELNNPYSLFDSKYSDHELNNLSWLKSEGQWNAKAVYPDAYNKLLKVYNGTETVEGLSVKLSTETYTDYDFVLNTADETFRLPLLDGSEDLISDKFIGQSFTATNSGYIIPITKNGQISIRIYGNTATDVTVNKNGNAVGTFNLQSNTYRQGTITTQVVKGDTIKVFASASGATATCNYLFFENTGNGSLYFYVGETVQNANLIDAGRIGEQLAGKVDLNASNLNTQGKSYISGLGMPSTKYIDLTVGADNTKYTAPANGWYSAKGLSGQYGMIGFETKDITSYSWAYNLNGVATFLPVKKGDVVTLRIISVTGSSLKFVYAEGSK